MHYGILTKAPTELPPDPVGQPSVVIATSDLPLACPRSDTPVWNLHPRVYLPITAQPDGEISCPYCGTCYKLIVSEDASD